MNRCNCDCHFEGSDPHGVCTYCTYLHDAEIPPSREEWNKGGGDHDVPYQFHRQPANYMPMLQRVRLTALRSRICGARAGESDDRYHITNKIDMTSEFTKETQP